jgi:hypothetical protein
MTSKRERVVGVTLHIVDSSGNARTVTIDPTRTEAIFWSDRAAEEILASFYGSIDKRTTKSDLVRRFGDGIIPIFNKLGISSEEVRITPDLVKEMWQLTSASGDKLAFIQKTVNCIPRPGG